MCERGHISTAPLRVRVRVHVRNCYLECVLKSTCSSPRKAVKIRAGCQTAGHGLNARAMMSVAMYSIRATLRSDCVRSARKAPGARGSFGSPPGSPPRPVRTRARRRGDEARRLVRWPWQLHAIGEDALVSSSGAGGGEWWFEFSSWCKSCKKGCGSPPRVGRGAL